MASGVDFREMLELLPVESTTLTVWLVVQRSAAWYKAGLFFAKPGSSSSLEHSEISSAPILGELFGAFLGGAV
jgi:hypothetical protein